MAEHNENQCSSCTWFLKKCTFDWYLKIDGCFNPERIKITGSEYRATNHQGTSCKYYSKGKQTRLGDF